MWLVQESRQRIASEHPEIVSMRNKALKERHWTAIETIVNKPITRDENFTLGVVIEYNPNDFRKTSSACAMRQADPGTQCPKVRPHKVPRQSCGCAPLTMLGAVLQRDVQMAPGFSGAHHAAPRVASVTCPHPRRTIPLPRNHLAPPSAVCRAAGRAPVSGAVLARPSCLLLLRLASPPLTPDLTVSRRWALYIAYPWQVAEAPSSSLSAVCRATRSLQGAQGTRPRPGRVQGPPPRPSPPSLPGSLAPWEAPGGSS